MKTRDETKVVRLAPEKKLTERGSIDLGCCLNGIFI